MSLYLCIQWDSVPVLMLLIWPKIDGWFCSVPALMLCSCEHYYLLPAWELRLHLSCLAVLNFGGRMPNPSAGGSTVAMQKL
jgi:hypothetical protein